MLHQTAHDGNYVAVKELATGGKSGNTRISAKPLSYFQRISVLCVLVATFQMLAHSHADHRLGNARSRCTPCHLDTLHGIMGSGLMQLDCGMEYDKQLGHIANTFTRQSAWAGRCAHHLDARFLR